jgi:hypothetical protein
MARPPRVPKPAHVQVAAEPSKLKLPALDSSAFSENPAQAQAQARPSSCRSASSSSSSQHFLQGFNVEDCFDVRSIPDPPTPQPRNRRRLSSPLVNLRSLEDVTNQNQANVENKNNKRSRKSLCHVPSPAEEQRDDLSGRNAPPKTLQIKICMDDNHNNEDHASGSKTKRRRKRQSMVLPKDLVEEHVNTFALDSPKKTNSESSSSLSQPKGFSGDLESMRELQKLVRGYCSLPMQRRDASQEAQRIEATTAYPIINPTLDKEDQNPLSHSNRKSILRGLAPVIEEMDKRKVEETQKWEEGTGCRVEKSTRSGKYRYYAIATNTKVGSSEYKNRYMAVLERESTQRLERTKEWKLKLKLALAPALDETQETLDTVSDTVQLLEVASPIEDCTDNMDEGYNSFAVTQDLDLDLSAIFAVDQTPPERPEQEPSPVAEEEDDMELCDLSVSLDWGETTNISLDIEPANNETEETGKSPEMDETPAAPEKEDFMETYDEEVEHLVTPAASTEDEEKGISEGDEEFNQEEVSPIDGPLLPLPDRDEGSRDPDIARAERKLWNRIDAALHEYSQEVKMIVVSKRTAGETTVLSKD